MRWFFDTMKATTAVTSCALVLGAALVACGSDSGGTSSAPPTLEGSLTQISNAVCERLKACSTTFATDFPGGVSDCESQVKGSAEQAAMSAGRDLNAVAQCTQAQVNACLSDINGATCDVVNSSSELPASCQGKC